MPTIPNNVDWAATAAWIALALSILSPIFTTKQNNKHQLELRKLDISEKQASALTQARISAIENFISSVGQCIANPSREHEAECGKNYFPVYAYVPESMWTKLDNLYSAIDDRDWERARSLYSEIAKPLALLLKETRQ